MTKEQIIEELKKSAKPYEEYYLDDEILSAMLHIKILMNL